MSTIFTDYVRSLASGEPPDERDFGRVLDALRGVLIHELKKRSLWTAPPSYLGITGATRWSDGNVLEELLYDAYAFIFVQRLPGLTKHSKKRRSINGLVFLNVRHFLHEAQKRHDPVGFRVFEVLHGALVQLIDEGALHVLDGDPRVRSDTILGPSPTVVPFPRQPKGGDETRGEDHGAEKKSPWPARIAAWCNDLLPDLMTAWKRDEAISPLAEKIRRLAAEGTPPFAFHELMEPLKKEVYRRWRAVARHEEGEVGYEQEEEDDEITQVPLVAPSNDFEERQSFKRLVECVEEGIAHRSETSRTRDYLRRLWLYLHNWAAPTRPGEENEAPGSGTSAGLPSDRQLSETLKIPRERFGELRGKLGELIERCLDASLVGPMRPSRPAHQEGGQAMDERDQRERLLRMTGEAAARLAGARETRVGESGARVGDVYVVADLPAVLATAPGEELPVEWVVLERGADGSRCRVVAADDRPWRGAHDLKVQGTDGAISILRCGVVAWVASAVLEAGERVAKLPEAVVEEARQRVEEAAAASASVELEDPEAADWQSRLETAAENLAGRTAASPYPRTRALRQRWLGLAASALLAVALISLVISWQRLGDLRRSNAVALERITVLEDALTQVDPPWAEVLPDELVRGEDTPVLHLEPDSLVAVLAFDVVAPEYPRYRLRFVETANGREIYSAELAASPSGTLRLFVPREIFESEGEIRVHLDGVTALGEIVPLEDVYTFEVEFVEGGAP